MASIRKLSPSKDGKERFQLRVYVGRDPSRAVYDENGTVVQQAPPIHVSKVFHGGIREAKKELAKLEVKAGEERTVGTTATVSKLLTEYLGTLERLGKASTTIYTYSQHAKNNIEPTLGNVRLNKLTGHQIDTWLAVLYDKGLAPGTVRIAFNTLKGALTQGVDWGWLASNPATRARLRTPETAPSDHLSIEQVRAIYDGALADDDIDMAALIVLAARTGCRRGELVGLQWEDLDPVECTLAVQRQWRAEEGGQKLAPPKNGKARTVHIGEEGVASLLRYKALKAAQLGWEPDGWLLSHDGGITPMRAKSVTAYFSTLAKRAGVDAHLHTLRHWSATELNRQGVDLPTAAAQLGHTTTVMAKVYLHTDDGRGAVAGDKMAAVLGRVFV
jgi:integrase